MSEIFAIKLFRYFELSYRLFPTRMTRAAPMSEYSIAKALEHDGKAHVVGG